MFPSPVTLDRLLFTLKVVPVLVSPVPANISEDVMFASTYAFVAASVEAIG